MIETRRKDVKEGMRDEGGGMNENRIQKPEVRSQNKRRRTALGFSFILDSGF
jgi:hypothetical protein